MNLNICCNLQANVAKVGDIIRNIFYRSFVKKKKFKIIKKKNLYILANKIDVHLNCVIWYPPEKN